MNLLPAVWRGATVVVDGAGSAAVAAAAPAERPVTLGLRPGDLRLLADEASADRALTARVELVEELGDSRIVDLTVGGHSVKLRSDTAGELHEGATVRLGFEPAAAHLFDRERGGRLN